MLQIIGAIETAVRVAGAIGPLLKRTPSQAETDALERDFQALIEELEGDQKEKLWRIYERVKAQ